MVAIKSLLLNTGELLPHGLFVNWTPVLLWLYVASDALIILAYYAISIMLIYFVLHRKDLRVNWIILMFGVFFLACGTTHLIGIITLWEPIYWIHTSMKAVTAAFFVYTVITLIKLMPRALNLPSISQFEEDIKLQRQTNEELRATKKLLLQTIKDLEACASEGLKELSQSENEHSSLLEAIPDALFELDLEGRYYSAHFPRFDLLAVPAEQLVGKNVHDVFPLEAAEIVLSSLHEAVEMGFSRGKQIELKLPQGTLWFELSVAIKNIPDKNYPRFIVLSHNITERKLSEIDLRIAATAFQTQEGILITDKNNAILRLNNALTTITGYSSEEILGQNPRFLSSSQQDEIFHFELWEHIVSNGQWEGDVLGERKNGESYPQHLSITSVNDSEGRITNYVYTLLDTSETKRNERERLINEIELRNTLIREVHHRIKNNLQGVTGFLSQLAENHPETASAVNQVIGKIQSISFIHGLKGSSAEGEVELNALIASIVTGVENLWKTKIMVEFDEYCKEINILDAESVPLALILNEIITNAVKHGENNTSIKVSPSQEIFPISIKIEITNTGKIPDNFDLQNTGHLGTGLQLTRLLLPRLGAKLRWEQVGNNVMTTLLMYPPVIQLQPYHVKSQFKLT